MVEYLKEELHEFMVPDWVGRWATPNDLWDMNRTLIVTYSDYPTSLYDSQLWPGVQHAWGDKRSNNPRGLKEFLKGLENISK